MSTTVLRADVPSKQPDGMNATPYAREKSSIEFGAKLAAMIDKQRAGGAKPAEWTPRPSALHDFIGRAGISGIKVIAPEPVTHDEESPAAAWAWRQVDSATRQKVLEGEPEATQRVQDLMGEYDPVNPGARRFNAEGAEIDAAGAVVQ
jgi:hypothetical protein